MRIHTAPLGRLPKNNISLFKNIPYASICIYVDAYTGRAINTVFLGAGEAINDMQRVFHRRRHNGRERIEDDIRIIYYVYVYMLRRRTLREHVYGTAPRQHPRMAIIIA